MRSSKILDGLRKQIDGIDRKILELINERGNIALKVSEHKKKNSLRIYDPSREKEIEKKLVELNSGPVTDDHIISIFRQVISGCRSLQGPTKVGYLGPQGSFSSQAAFHKFGRSAELVPFGDLEDIFEEIRSKRLEFGIIPVENSVEGSIGSVLDILLSWDLTISSEHFERINHFFLSKTGRMDDVKVLASHPQALGQCKKWIGSNFKNVEILETSSTAAAAKIAAGDKKTAAIASDHAASIYNLKIIQSCIEDDTQNTTRFLIMGHENTSITGEDKTSIVFSLKDEPGTLHKSFFLPFAEQGVNLSKIESRPCKDRAWEYVFFVDFIGHHEDKKIKRLIRKVEKNCIFLKILGSYPIGKVG